MHDTQADGVKSSAQLAPPDAPGGSHAFMLDRGVAVCRSPYPPVIYLERHPDSVYPRYHYQRRLDRIGRSFPRPSAVVANFLFFDSHIPRGKVEYKARPFLDAL